MTRADISAYHARQAPEDAAMCDVLAKAIDAGLPEADGKLWHGHPVWFLDGNPIVGYGKLKHCVRLLFWSGQSFPTPGLVGTGKFKAAEWRFVSVDDVDLTKLAVWLEESRSIQWDYKNIVKRRGLLERLQ